jgi:hypothetical protein
LKNKKNNRTSLADGAAVLLALTLLALSSAHSPNITAAGQTSNSSSNSGLGDLSSAYAQVNRAEGLGVSKNLIFSWTGELNNSAFLLQQAGLPSNANRSQSMIENSISISNSVQANATKEANFYYVIHIVVLVVAYGLIIPSSYGLAIVTNKLYEYYVKREEDKFSKRAIRRRSE